MIEARTLPEPASFSRNLAERAEAIATARSEEHLRAARADPSRWRLPGLLWPLFTKG